MSTEHPERDDSAEFSESEHLYCYRLVGGPMDGSSHLMVSDVMEMALPVTVSEESEFEHDQLHSGSEDPVDGALERPVVGYSGSSSVGGSVGGSGGGEDQSSNIGYYHLYLWYGKVVEGSRVMEYHGYLAEEED